MNFGCNRGERFGYPDRAYATWHGLHFLRSRLGSELRKKAIADVFRSISERSWNKHLDDTIRLVYLAALAFYRHKRGKGATAVDVSNFFYRSETQSKVDHPPRQIWSLCLSVIGCESNDC